MRTAVVLAVFLAGCGGDLTAGEATSVASAEITNSLPQVTEFDGYEITTRDFGDKWRVTYRGGTGGFIVDVEKHTRRAVIVEMQQ